MKCTEYKTRREVAELVFTIIQLFINLFTALIYSGYHRVHILLTIFINYMCVSAMGIEGRKHIDNSELL